jgi:hypothetical protein
VHEPVGVGGTSGGAWDPTDTDTINALRYIVTNDVNQ